MFLVVLRHMMDDVPYRLCKTREEALEVTATATEELAYAIADRLQIDCNTPVVWTIVEFGDGGDPVCIHFGRRAKDIENPRLTTTLRPEDLKGIPSAGDPPAWTRLG